MYKKCSLYGLKSKRMLFQLLGITNKAFLKSNYVQRNIFPYIDKTTKPRLIEAPSIELKVIQRKIKNYLLNCDIPDYVYSGIKNKSYVDNAKMHRLNCYLYKLDISAFFPNISREKVYIFFNQVLKTSQDVACCLTNFCTADLSVNNKNNEEISQFLTSKHIKHKNHLCTGCAASPVLSYLVNKEMFDEILNICKVNNMLMTIYVDDIVISSPKPINHYLRSKIVSTVNKYGFNISKNKVRYYTKNDTKEVTGVIIKKNGTLDVPNKLRWKIKRRFDNVTEDYNLKKLQGCIIAARQIMNAYPSLWKYVKLELKNKQHNV